MKINYSVCYSVASDVFLTEPLPLELLDDDSGSFDKIDDFIDANKISMLSNLSASQIWEMIAESGEAMYAMNNLGVTK